MSSEESLVLSVVEAGRLINCGRNKAYELARTGQLPTIRLGRKLVVPRAAFVRWLAEAGSQKVHEEQAI